MPLYGCNDDENVEHMLFTCPHASQVWTAVGLTLNQGTNMATSLLTLEQNHTHQPGSELATAIIAVAWNIWLARNMKVFDNVTTSCSAIKNNSVQTLELWKHRTKKEARRIAIKAWTQNWEQTAGSSETTSD